MINEVEGVVHNMYEVDRHKSAQFKRISCPNPHNVEIKNNNNARIFGPLRQKASLTAKSGSK